MDISFVKKPKIRISYDEMEAFLLLPTPVLQEPYDLDEVLEMLKSNGVKIGIDEEKISTMIRECQYDREYLVAKGIDVVDGVDAYFEFHFNTVLNKVPSLREDGSVDYWSIHSVELVEEGQIIATYHEPVMGSNGMNVKGKMLFAKKGRPLPPLTGRGFDRSSDNKIYTSQIDGKIEKQNNRILISSVHEVHGDVGLKTGNIDFRGDVIVHGNVPTGAVIRATGSITVDGTVEGALLDANKDVIIRGGMLGGGRGIIKSRGEVHAKFLEYVEVKADGDVNIGSAVNCDITTNGKVFLKGKLARIVGGVVHAAMGLEGNNLGNDYGVKTEVYVGVNMEVKKEITYHENCVKEAQDMIDKINMGIQQLDEAIKAGEAEPTDPRKGSLLRTKIVKQADLATHTQQLNKMMQIVGNAQGACIEVLHFVHPGVIVGINDSIHHMLEAEECIAFHEKEANVVMYSMKGDMVS